nr:hypothetical protein [Tanacetum cinerariifolium]
VALDEALVPSTQRLRIGRSNFRLPFDIQSKESTLQVVYDVLRNSPFFRAFLVTADVPEIYIPEFWATAKLHHNSIRFKMDTKKSVLDLEAFREMLHITTTIEQPVALDEALVPSVQKLRIGRSNFRLPSDIQSKESTLQVVYDVLRRSPFFKAFLVTADVPEIYMQDSGQQLSFINNPLDLKWTPERTLRLSQAQILWGLYHRSNVDYAFLIWEDFVYQVEHTNQKKSNEMYYPRFTKVIIHHFMTRKPSIPRRNKVNWHYVRDDIMNTKAYKEYYACATREAALKPKASARKKKGGSASSTTPPTPIATPTPTTIVVAAPRLTVATKGKQPARARSPTEPLDVERTEAEQLKIVLERSRHETHISQQGGSSTDEGTGSRPGDEAEKVNDDDDDEEEIFKIGEQEATESDEGDDEATKSDRENSDDDDNNEEDQSLRIGKEERMHDEEEANELYRDVDINQGRGLQVSKVIEDSHVTLTPTHSDGQQESSSTSSFITNLLNPTIDPGMESIFTTGSSTVTLIPLPQSTMTPSIISTFTTASQLPIPPTPIPSLDLQNLPTFASVFRFEDKVKSLEVNFSNIPADLSEMKLKKILIEKMEGNKSIQLSDEQQNLYKALVEAYDADKTILDTYGESGILKRRRKDDDQEGPFAGSDRGSKRRREGGEHASASTLSKPASGSTGRSTTGTQSRQLSASESAFAEEPVQTTCQMEEPSHPVFETGAEDQPIIQTSQHPEWFS